MRNDLAKLGYELPEGRETTYEMNVEGRAYTGHVRHAKLRDAAVCTLLRALGASEGDKVKNGVKIPAWLLKAPLGVQKEFLAAYLGGDVTVPRMVGRNLVSQSSVGFHRIVQKEESGLELAGQLTELLSNFGIAVNRIERNPGYRRKDGFDTLEISTAVQALRGERPQVVLSHRNQILLEESHERQPGRRVPQDQGSPA